MFPVCVLFDNILLFDIQVGGSSCLPCTATHLEASVSSKESEQPSPVSVLEAPFVEDLSSGSECFERVSADLHGKFLSVVQDSRFQFSPDTTVSFQWQKFFN